MRASWLAFDSDGFLLLDINGFFGEREVKLRTLESFPDESSITVVGPLFRGDSMLATRTNHKRTGQTTKLNGASLEADTHANWQTQLEAKYPSMFETLE